MDTNWIEEYAEEATVSGRNYGYSEAHLLIAEIVTELYADGNAEAARLIHERVWKRLQSDRETRLRRS